MGVEVSASWLVVFLATLIAFGTLYPAANNAGERMADAGAAELQDDREQRKTEIEIKRVEWDGNQVTIKVKNTGQTKLTVNGADVLVNGEYYSPSEGDEYSVDGDSDTDIWRPRETLRIVLSTPTPNRVKVVTEHGLAQFTEKIIMILGDGVVFTNSTSDLLSPEQNQSIMDSYDITDSQVIGPLAEGFGNDSADEIPFVDSNNNLFIVDNSGEKHNLTEGAKAQYSRLTIGTWQGSPTSVFYVDTGTNNIRRVTPDGSDNSVISLTADGVAGIADFDGDGNDELIYGGNSPTGLSDSINYIDDDETIHGTGVSYGENNGIGVGEPADFDSDGTARVPIVDGSNVIKLVDQNGNTETLTSGIAMKAPLASLDWDGDGESDIVFLNTNGRLRYIDNVTGSNTVKTIKDESGNEVTADDDAGAA